MVQALSKIRAIGHSRSGLRLALAGIVLLALLIRLLYIPFALRYDPYLSQYPLLGDGEDYDAIGLNLCQGNGFAVQEGQPTSRRAPGYPVFLALVYCTVGHSLLLARISQAFLGAGSVLLIFFIARRYYGVGVALVAALIMALHPIVIYFGAFIGTEALFLLLLCAAFLAAIRIADRPSACRLVTLGLLQAAAALVRPQAMLYWPVLAGWALFIKRRESFRRGIGKWLLVVIISVLGILPWTVRNYLLHDEFVLIDTHGGWTLYGSYALESSGEFVARWDPAAWELTEYERDRFYYQLAFDFIRAHPVKFVTLVPAKIGRLFSPIAVVEKEYPLSWALEAKIIYALFLVPSFVGMALAASSWRESSLLYANVLVNLLTAAIFYGCTRFVIPMLPALVIFAALALVRLADRIALRLQRRSLA